MAHGIPDSDWVDVSIDKNYNIRRKVDPTKVQPSFDYEYQYGDDHVAHRKHLWYKGLPNGYYADYVGEVAKTPRASPIPPKHEEKHPTSKAEEGWEPLEVKEEYQFIDTNPKTAFGAVKPGTFQTPPMPLYEYSLAHYQGSLKYGHYNWREDPVSISTYINAARRHIDLYLEGQKEAADTSIHNLAHAMTCLSIVIDAEWYGTLLDDRAVVEVRADEKLEEYFESKKPLVQRITKDWFGHAQKLKDKLKLNKEKK